MPNNVKEAAQPKLNGLQGDQPFDSSDCIADQAFSQTRVDAVFDEIASILGARTSRLEGMLALIEARRG